MKTFYCTCYIQCVLVKSELMSSLICVYLTLIGYYGYDIEEYDKTSGGFIYKTSTEFYRIYGNFASSVFIDSGVEDWCTYSKSDKKSKLQDHSKPFPEHPEDDKLFPSNN